MECGEAGPSVAAMKTTGYTSLRPDLAAVVLNNSPERILDVGCSNGTLAQELRRRSQGHIRIVGVELDPLFAAEASLAVDEFISGDAMDALAELRAAGREFDAIIFGDVLEHLVDPWACVDDAVAILSPEGIVTVSLPNVAHWTTFYNLAFRKSWPRRDRGLFDGTHLRWFAERDVRKLLDSAGLELVELRRKPRIADKPGGRLNRLSALAVRLWPTGFTYQFLVTARRKSSRPSP